MLENFMKYLSWAWIKPPDLDPVLYMLVNQWPPGQAHKASKQHVNLSSDPILVHAADLEKQGSSSVINHVNCYSLYESH